METLMSQGEKSEDGPTFNFKSNMSQADSFNYSPKRG